MNVDTDKTSCEVTLEGDTLIELEDIVFPTDEYHSREGENT